MKSWKYEKYGNKLLKLINIFKICARNMEIKNHFPKPPTDIEIVSRILPVWTSDSSVKNGGEIGWQSVLGSIYFQIQYVYVLKLKL